MSPQSQPNILKRGSRSRPSNGITSSLKFTVYRAIKTLDMGNTRFYLATPVAVAALNLTTNQVSGRSLQNGVVAAPSVCPATSAASLLPDKTETEILPQNAIAAPKIKEEYDDCVQFSYEETVEAVSEVLSVPIHGGLGVAQLEVCDSAPFRLPGNKDRKEELEEILRVRAKKDPAVIRRLLRPVRRVIPTNRDRLIALDLIKYGFAKSDRGAADFAGVTTDAIRDWKKKERLIRAADPDAVSFLPAGLRTDEVMEVD